MKTSWATLVYPPVCLLCRSPLLDTADALCETCVAAMPVMAPPVCQRCGCQLQAAYDARLLCRACQRSSWPFTQARAPLSYRGAAQQTIQAFKYHGHRRLGHWLADQMAPLAGRQLPLAQIAFIAPVPMHWLKARAKGWNPCAELARALAQRLGKPCHPSALRRIRWTPSQTRFTKSQRRRNVHRAFRADQALCRDATILLVDDVLTTGATASACAAALRAAGGRAVFVLTAARAFPP